MTLTVLFYVFALLALISGFSVIIARNPVRSVLSLVFCFFFTAVLWLLMEAEFLALVLIVVYVGAVMVLFLFVVMMLDIQVASRKASFVAYWPLAAVCGALILIMLIWALGSQDPLIFHMTPPTPHAANYSNLSEVGLAIFKNHLYPFELAAVLLLAAMISAIALTHRGRRTGAKMQNPAAQVQVKAKDRLQIIKMPGKNAGGQS